MKFKIIYENARGEPLEDWMKTIDWKLPRRMLYVMKANVDHSSIVKIGVCGLDRGYAKSRFNEYLAFYGQHNKQNPCAGIKIYMCCATDYNPLVETKKTAIWRLELVLKRIIKTDGEGLNRGTERTTRSFRDIASIIKENQDKISEESNDRRVSNRNVVS